MNRIGLYGINWRQGGPEALARFTLPTEGRAQAVAEMARTLGVRELVYLATCNRVELLLVAAPGRSIASYRAPIYAALSGDPAPPGEAARALRAWAGEGALEHLLLVAAGLESARVGETDIAAQVRRAYEDARAAELVGSRLELACEEALRVARRVHASTGVDAGRESLAEIGLDHVRARLAGARGPVALVGVSPMTERCGRSLANEGAELVWVNRSLERAQERARELGGVSRSLDEFRAEPSACEALVCSTAAPDAVLGRAALERLAARSASGTPPLVIDFAIPPDVEPADAEAAGLERLGMQEILAQAELSREGRLNELADARELVDQALASLRRRLVDQLVSPLCAALQRRYRATASEGLGRLFQRELDGLDAVGRAALERWAETLAGRYAHLATTGVREVARESGPEAVRAFFAHADPELRAALSAAAASEQCLDIDAGASAEEGAA